MKKYSKLAGTIDGDRICDVYKLFLMSLTFHELSLLVNDTYLG